MYYFAERNTSDLEKQIWSFLSHMENTHTHVKVEALSEKRKVTRNQAWGQKVTV